MKVLLAFDSLLTELSWADVLVWVLLLDWSYQMTPPLHLPDHQPTLHPSKRDGLRSSLSDLIDNYATYRVGAVLVPVYIFKKETKKLL
jgi:hypothetical protein